MSMTLTPEHWQADTLARVARLDLPAVARRMKRSRLAVIDLLGEVLAHQDAEQARQTRPATPPRRRALQPLRFQRPHHRWPTWSGRRESRAARRGRR